MNLFYLPKISEGINHLDQEESHHVVKVLRKLVGDELTITDGKGMLYQVTINTADPKKCLFDIVTKKEQPKRNHYTHIAIAPTKNADRIEWFVEKAVEIGIDEISFMLCQTSERKTINLDRVEKIAISAMKQSQQAWLPKLNPMLPFKDLLQNSSSQKFIGFVDSSNPTHLKNAAKPKNSYLVLIGPEGDFSNEELTSAIENGFEKISLGANRLRTETAGLVACHIFHLLNC